MSHLSCQELAEAGSVASQDRAGGGRKTPAPAGALTRTEPRASGRARRLKTCLKALGICACTLGLAAIGQVSMRLSPSASLQDGEAEQKALAGLGQPQWLASQQPRERKPAPRPIASSAPTKDASREVKPANSPCAKSSSDQTAASVGVTADGKIILNLASAEEFTRLAGIGTKRAQAIVKLRERLKRFRRPTDLLRVRGIGPKSLKRMLPQLVLDPPAEGPPEAPPKTESSRPTDGSS